MPLITIFFSMLLNKENFIVYKYRISAKSFGRCQQLYDVVSKKQLAPTVKSIEVKAPRIAEKSRPGQFVTLRINEKGEKIPLTIVKSDPENGTITLVVQEVGKTTTELGQLEVGESIRDVLGPLGNPSEIKKYGTVVMVGGGVGAALVYPVMKSLKEAGNKIITIVGARAKELLILEKELEEISDEFYVTTDDGSKGHHGFVTDVLKKLIGEKKIDLVFAVGPTVMMKAVANLTRPQDIRTVVSLNPIMVDGTGMCGGCRVSVGGATKFCCVDGPEFDAHLVDFDELTARLRIYSDEEKRCMSLHQEKRE